MTAPERAEPAVERGDDLADRAADLAGILSAAGEQGVGSRFLFARFRTFWALVSENVETARLGAAPVPGGTAVDIEPMARRLEACLTDGEAEALGLGGAFGGALYREAMYAMAALADEVFITGFDWPGAIAWRDRPLEMRLFGTAVAGERLFQRIDALLAEGDPARAEVAAVYQMTLALGFQGRWRGGRDLAPVLAARRGLTTLIARRTGSSPGQPLFAESYAHTLDQGEVVLRPAVARWIWAVVVFMGLWLSVQHGLWLWLTADIRSLIASGAGG